MKNIIIILTILFSVVLSSQESKSKRKKPIPNPQIDYEGFQKIVNTTAEIREKRRLTEEDFLSATQEKGIVLLDARSESKYRLRHIKGAVNLQFTDFTEKTLSEIIPAKDTKIIIYCNNNFEGSETAFAPKATTASLNLSTFTSLVSYGYTNVCELGPLLNIETTRIPFAGSEVK